jgi:hypothetical protein
MTDALASAIRIVREAAQDLDRAASDLDRTGGQRPAIGLLEREAGRLRELHQLLLDAARERDGEASEVPHG